MTVDDLIVEFRDEADDQVGPDYLWTDATLLRYANDAQLEAATRAHFFVESASALSRAKVKAGTGIAVLDPNIIRVRAVRVLGTDCALRGAYRRDMLRWPAWEDETGEACRFIRDYSSNQIRLHPKPVADVVIQMTVVRGPSAALEAGSDLEIPVRYQRKLVNWMLYRAFSRKDSAGDARDDRRAKEALDRFTADFGPAVSAIDEVFAQQQQDVYDDQFGND